jgi:copper(I)-binding protein
LSKKIFAISSCWAEHLVMNRTFRFFFLCVCAVTFPVWGAVADDAASVTDAKAADTLDVRDAWLRAPVMAGRPAAGYFTVKNPGQTEDRLVAVTSPAASRVELHTHIKDGNRMMMRPIEAVDVPAEGMVRFEPQGHHLMLFGLQTVTPGDRVTLTLKFENHPAISVSAVVVGTADGNPYPSNHSDTGDHPHH